MHTTTFTDNEGYEWTVHHNGDYSGETLIDVHHSRVEINDDNVPLLTHTVKLPFELLEGLVGDRMRSEAIARLEGRTGQEMVRGLTQRDFS
jgi:hypothetical protein